MQRVSEQQVGDTGLQQHFSVMEFCRRYRLGPQEERRLTSLLGDHATHQQLLLNARRDPQVF